MKNKCTNYLPGFGRGSLFIQSLCKALDDEYGNVNSPSRSKKMHKRSDLTQLFTTLVTTSVGLSKNSQNKQTPEFRSCLSKMIRFQSTNKRGRRLENGYFDGNLEYREAFKTARKKWKSKGYKKRKRISDKDYIFLLKTIHATAPGAAKEVQQAIAWVILNRYNSNKIEWGGSKSLEDVCKNLNPSWDGSSWVGTNILDWVPTSIFDSNKDPTLGATYFKIAGSSVSQMTIPQDYRATIKIGNYHFFKDPLPQQQLSYLSWPYNCNIL